MPGAVPESCRLKSPSATEVVLIDRSDEVPGATGFALNPAAAPAGNPVNDSVTGVVKPVYPWTSIAYWAGPGAHAFTVTGCGSRSNPQA